MFRTAMLRSAVRASAAVRPAVARSAVFAAPRMNVVVAPRVALWSRGYAAAAGLQRQEVEDRIKALLQGFDKVRFRYRR
jgi:NADH dehydrogenase (ubiquinone) 1 alpha/beta subcomplex 1